jgi:hypothetical protein
MQLTNRVVYDAVPALVELSRRELPIKLAHEIALTLRALRPQAQVVEEFRQKFIDKYCETDDEGKRVMGRGPQGEPTVQLRDQEGFAADWREYLEQTDDFTVRPVAMNDLGSDVKIAPWVIDALLEANLLTVDGAKPKPRRKPRSKK